MFAVWSWRSGTRVGCLMICSSSLEIEKWKASIFTLKMKFLPKNFPKIYKFRIKSVVLYPKMYIWSWKNKIFVLFTLKMKFLPKYFTKMYKFWIKSVVLYPKMYIWSRKIEKFVLFTLEMKFLPKYFTKMYKFWIKTVVLYPKMYIWFEKKIKNLYFLKQKWNFCQKISLKCTNFG